MVERLIGFVEKEGRLIDFHVIARSTRGRAWEATRQSHTIQGGPALVRLPRYAQQ
jgi:hypothetical protein